MRGDIKPELISLMLECGLLNYVDNETPRQYFLAGWVSEEDLYEYTKKLIELCATIAENAQFTIEGPSKEAAYQRFLAADVIRVKLGLKPQSPINAL